MKSIEVLYNEIAGSAELQNELKAASDETKLIEFLKKHGCDADVKEFKAFVRSQSEGEIEDDDTAAIAGGVTILTTYSPAASPLEIL